MTAATSPTIDIHELSLDASTLFFIVDRLDDAVNGRPDQVEEACAMARLAHQLATKLDSDLKALANR